MRVETNLPDEVHTFTYVKNSHYIKLTDRDGRSLKLIPASLRQGKCKNCPAVFYMESNFGDDIGCPSCGAKEIEWSWGGVQLCFVPEAESDFQPPPQKK